jgi:hypothetical protein
MRKNNRALGAQMKITRKALVQSYGDWVIEHLNFPHQEDPLTHLVRKMSACPHGTLDQVSKWMEEYLDLEWTPYHMVFMFRHIPGSDGEKNPADAQGYRLFFMENWQAGWYAIQGHPNALAFCREPCSFPTCLALRG